MQLIAPVGVELEARQRKQTQQDDASTEEAFRQIADTVRAKRLLIDPEFKDYDRVRRGIGMYTSPSSRVMCFCLSVFLFVFCPSFHFVRPL